MKMANYGSDFCFLIISINQTNISDKTKTINSQNLILKLNRFYLHKHQVVQ